MAGKEELDIEINENGQVQVHVKGIKGSRCLEYVEIFKALLGPVQEEALTPEYYEVEMQTHVHQQRRNRFS